MKKGRRIIAAVMAFTVLGVLVRLGCFSHEPSYHGRELSVWLEQYADTQKPDPKSNDKLLAQESEFAIRRIGTNGIPILLAFVRASDSTIKSNLIVLVRGNSWVPFHPRSERECHRLAAFGFYALGENGKPAVPELILCVTDQNEKVRQTAADCLGNVGPPAKAAVSKLLPLLGSTNKIVRWATMLNLGKIHAEPEMVVPVLIKEIAVSVASRDRLVPTILKTIATFGEFAKEAIPTITALLHDEDIDVRVAATNAIVAIDPTTMKFGSDASLLSTKPK